MKNQKGISLITLLLVIVVLVSIFIFKAIFNNNTENTNTNNNSSTNIKAENKKSSSIVGSWQSGVVVYTFNSDGTANLSGTGINTQNFTYKIKGNTISLTNQETKGTMKVEYSINNEQLYIGTETFTKVK